MDGEERVEEVSQTDAVSLGDQPQQVAIAIEGPRASNVGDRDPCLVVPVQQLVGDLAGRILVGEFESVRPKPLDADHRYETIG